MTTATVFYSWQSDRPRSINRNFIYSALAQAVSALSGEVYEAIRVESDTTGAGGTPPVADTIYRRIASSAVFVADVSFVGSNEMDPARGGNYKLLPNANVMIELGFAAARLGWNRVLLIMNSHWGAPEELPFDLRHHRFPLRYSLSPGATVSDMEQELRRFGPRLNEALAIALNQDNLAADDALAGLDHYAIRLVNDKTESEWGVNLSFGSMASISGFDLAVLRLLQLGLIVTSLPVTHSDQYRTARYQWTSLGRLVQRKVRAHFDHDM